MTLPTHVIVCKAVLILVKGAETFNTYKGTFWTLYLEIKEHPKFRWVGYIKSASGAIIGIIEDGYGCSSPEEAAKELEHQVESLSIQLAGLLNGPKTPA